MASVTQPEKVNANLVYSVAPPDGSRAFLNISAQTTTGDRKTNVATVTRGVEIENVRGKEDSVTFDDAGFQFYTGIPAKYKSFANDEEIKREYYPESAELIKKLTGASRVELFDHTIRRRRPGQTEDDPSKRQPVPNVHVDQTPRSSVNRVLRHLPSSEAPELLKRHFQLINLWRPIGHAAYDWPLAMCDYRSVNPEKDTFPVALIYPNQEGETMGVQYNENHKWKYLRGMTPDEFVLFKCYDSVQDGSVAPFTPHTSFEDPSTPSDAPLRESIELRALVFYD